MTYLGKAIETPPSFTRHLSDVTIDADNDVILSCVLRGFPEPKVEWMYNEEVITSEDGVDISFESGVATLMLEQAAQEDSGCYSCIATNSEGRAMSQCRVIVNDSEFCGKPRFYRNNCFTIKSTRKNFNLLDTKKLVSFLIQPEFFKFFGQNFGNQCQKR